MAYDAWKQSYYALPSCFSAKDLEKRTQTGSSGLHQQLLPPDSIDVYYISFSKQDRFHELFGPGVCTHWRKPFAPGDKECSLEGRNVTAASVSQLVDLASWSPWARIFGTRRTWCMSHKRVCSSMSHHAIWQAAAVANRSTLILEEDTLLDKTQWASLPDRLSALWQKIPQADIILLGAISGHTVGKMSGILCEWIEVVHFFGNHAYILRPEGAKLLLQGALPVRSSSDVFMADRCRENPGRCWVPSSMKDCVRQAASTASQDLPVWAQSMLVFYMQPLWILRGLKQFLMNNLQWREVWFIANTEEKIMDANFLVWLACACIVAILCILGACMCYSML